MIQGDRHQQPARLPALGEYLMRVAPHEKRQRLWAWATTVPVATRKGSHVLDLRFPPGPDGYVGDEWVPVAEHPEWSIWIVRRAS